MSVAISVKWDRSGMAALETGPFKAAVKRALRKSGATALRDMRSEAVKRIRARKAIRPKYISRAITLSRPKGGDISAMEWAVRFSGDPVPLIAFPHRATKARRLGQRRQGPVDQGGVVVEVNRGKRTLVRGAFIATMDNGHEGIFKRRGAKRNPIFQLLGSRPVDALLHEGEAEGIAARGSGSFSATFERLLPLEIAKSSKTE